MNLNLNLKIFPSLRFHPYNKCIRVSDPLRPRPHQAIADLEPLALAIPPNDTVAFANFHLEKHTKPAHFDCPWSIDDDTNLLKGISEHGLGNWEAIKIDTSLHLYDKVTFDPAFTRYPTCARTHFPPLPPSDSSRRGDQTSGETASNARQLLAQVNWQAALRCLDDVQLSDGEGRGRFGIRKIPSFRSQGQGPDQGRRRRNSHRRF